MSFIVHSKARYSIFASVLIFGISQTAFAGEKSVEALSLQCPLNSVVRVSNASTTQHFQALSGCSDHIVQAAVPRVEALPPVARIIGVKDEEENSKEKRKSRRSRYDETNKSVPIVRRPAYDGEIRQVAARYKIDPLFIHAMVATESAARPRARSHKGAMGLMQIMPATGAMLGVAPPMLFDPATNLDAGARYLKKLQKRFGGDFELILSAYNAGEGAVQKYGNRIPPYAETQAYVTSVMGRYGSLRLAGLENGVVR